MALTGRERELAVIDGLLGRLHGGGGAMLLRGEAGIGKSALLEEAEQRASERGITILKTAGVPSERQMAFAGLHRLLRPYNAGIADLPAPQAAALASAFGGAGGARAPDLFLIALAALDLLAEAAADAPLLLAVEDAHWLDPDTCEVLAFVARRVDLEPIALLFALRDGHPSRLDDARLPELSLATLDGEESARLLDAHAPELTPELRRRVLDVAGGNPLALLELPRALSSGQLAASALTPLPITDALERAFSDRVTELPAATRSVLLVAALGEACSLQEILAAASHYEGRPVSTDELGAAEAAALVTVTDAGVQFRHPLVRAAVYHDAPTAARHAAHVALAEAHAADPDRSVWHRAAACSGPDAAVASELEAAAARALQRGATTLAAASLERAAQLTPDPSARGGLLLRAAEMAFELGRSDLAGKLLDQARPLPLREPERARLALLLEAADED
ncbi:MAG TPA: ATP-binding protein, partial [Solirubrobacteraceae bacterium]|nr:ATP-binding protein [Solirubrobacteraceae bacterium]